MIHIALLSSLCFAEDPYVLYDFKLSYITVFPLGVPQQVTFQFNLPYVSFFNGELPAQVVNATTNYNVAIDVLNQSDENLLMTWPGIQMQRNSWQNGVLGANCHIQPKKNFAYQFQVKDQIGSFSHFPSLNFQRASGGFGAIIINNRNVIAIPFALPDGHIVILIGDWYTQNPTALRTILGSGGVLINGKGPYRYNTTLVPAGIEYESINVDPGIHFFRCDGKNQNLPISCASTGLNFRIQGHKLLLVQTEGHYTTQQNFTSFDIHVGQSYSFLVTMDQNATTDYYIVASARFLNESAWERVTGVAISHIPIQKDQQLALCLFHQVIFTTQWSAMNQPRAIRQNTTPSGDRPNPQGSFHYGSIEVTDTYVLRSLPPLHAILNGISFVNPDTPIRLAEMHNVKGAYKLDLIMLCIK
uniref:Plastocyanin-like domain-containing protein n=1 Tax=Gossypium raimondii TaxID=29730 RepID=A0A0D2SA91_GOSRA|nr:hypothetical protein B456_006G269000 [Gossypium raimondii]